METKILFCNFLYKKLIVNLNLTVMFIFQPNSHLQHLTSAEVGRTDVSQSKVRQLGTDQLDW